MKMSSVFILILLISLLFSGCSQTESTDVKTGQSEGIVGTWENVQELSPDQSQLQDGELSFDGNTAITYVFNEDGTFKETTSTNINYSNGNNESSSVEYEGTYTLDGDKLTTKITVFDGQTEDQMRQEMQNTNPSLSDESIPAFEPTESTIKLDGNKLTIESSDLGAIEYTRKQS